MINKELQKRIFSSIILIPIALFFIIKGSVFFIFFLGIFLLSTIYEWHKMNKQYLLKFFGLIYLICVSSLAYLLRENFELNIFIFVIMICIFTDVGGYVFGKIFKGPKLTKISPNKTYSGVFGSFFLSLMGGIFYLKYLSISSLPMNETIKVSIIIFTISLISQIGDLVISYFKRKAKIKNTGKILPGHGGILDRVDGIIFAIPASYLLFNFLN
tara:strand:+ start:1319 stop:1960 length:642 start_codon:yes stop_codon:yes gene_type:complete